MLLLQNSNEEKHKNKYERKMTVMIAIDSEKMLKTGENIVVTKKLFMIKISLSIFCNESIIIVAFNKFFTR